MDGLVRGKKYTFNINSNILNGIYTGIVLGINKNGSILLHDIDKIGGGTERVIASVSPEEIVSVHEVTKGGGNARRRVKYSTKRSKRRSTKRRSTKKKSKKRKYKKTKRRRK